MLRLSLGFPLVMMAFISACGGGSSGNTTGSGQVADAPVAEVDSQSEPVEQTSTPQEVAPLPTELADLSVTQAFDFSNQSEVVVTFNRPKGEGQYHGALCTSWLDEETGTVDYDSCLWRGQLYSPSLVVELMVPAHHSFLIAQLWQIESGQFNRLQQQVPLQAFLTIHF